MTTVTKKDVTQACRRLGIALGDTMIVHSSLKSLGYVQGGADAVIDGLLDALGEDGTLVMPTLIMKDFRKAYETWYMDKPSDVGIITETFRRRAGVVRSNQETHSVAACGKLAQEIIANHGQGHRIGTYGDTPFAHSSPWQKLADLNAGMLFIGCGMDKCTIKHLAEYTIVERIVKAFPEAQEKIRRFWQRGEGFESQFWPYVDHDRYFTHFCNRGMVRTTKCGDATLLYLHAGDCLREMVKYVSINPRYYIAPGCLHQDDHYTWLRNMAQE